MKKYCYAFTAIALFLTACSKDDEKVAPEDPNVISSSRLDFIEVNGSAHGDHFHDLAEKTGEKDSIAILFNAQGETQNGHLHLDPHKVYRIQLRVFNKAGHELQQGFLQNKTVADSFKVFLTGGNFVLNPTTGDAENGAIFQPREQVYGDGTSIGGKYETTGILAYFTLGEANSGAEADISYVLRKFTDPATKAKIERTDWNYLDYATRYAGTDILKLTFEVHAEEHE
ncbi:hypothetical protein [Chitinophaga pinensis]|uniref:Lipoprotein n=1 Tax=Chitinophaga pinensis (strain ATCC 43595 / DSM 2588 / LMG 13176 / NBRC 15968 / NCIMB 11800 / UQM 2034) TaxID=485918 RepID=A0A979FZ18_CHIPD|nr:hypothetical protein [Chitinophaga pinensis]ACU57707.1 hypothetical protein Cpin_0206 [Chitinophaga pinensis DSM 2588]